jgi:hypothetical protein
MLPFHFDHLDLPPIIGYSLQMPMKSDIGGLHRQAPIPHSTSMVSGGVRHQAWKRNTPR